MRQTEPVPRPKSLYSHKAADENGPKSRFVPLSNTTTTSDLGRPAHWGAIVATAGRKTLSKNGAKTRLQQHSPPRTD